MILTEIFVILKYNAKHHSASKLSCVQWKYHVLLWKSLWISLTTAHIFLNAVFQHIAHVKLGEDLPQVYTKFPLWSSTVIWKKCLGFLLMICLHQRPESIMTRINSRSISGTVILTLYTVAEVLTTPGKFSKNSWLLSPMYLQHLQKHVGSIWQRKGCLLQING